VHTRRYSHYAVSLAYHVIAMWFIKCRQPFKRGFVQYIVKVCSFCCLPVYYSAEFSSLLSLFRWHFGFVVMILLTSTKLL